MASVAPQLKRLRASAHPRITVRGLAEAVGMPASTYAAYEDANKFKKPALPLDLAKKIADVLEGRGVARAKVLQLAGLTESDILIPVTDHPPTRNASADDGTVDIIALDLSLSMGPGTLIEEFVEQEPVKWDIGTLRVITRSPFHVLRQVRGIGDSMEPTLRTNDRVLIDTSEKMLSRMHGIYWIDHLGSHGLKRLRAAGQGRVLIMSDNSMVEDYEVDAEEVRIHGRAIWFGREL